MNRLSKLVASTTDPATGWDAHLSGRWLLWVAAPDATVPVTQLGLSLAAAAAAAQPR